MSKSRDSYRRNRQERLMDLLYSVYSAHGTESHAIPDRLGNISVIADNGWVILVKQRRTGIWFCSVTAEGVEVLRSHYYPLG